MEIYQKKYAKDVEEVKEDTKVDPTDKDKEVIEEAVDVKAVIKEVIDTNWSGSNEEQLKAVQLLKGLATSEDPLSNKFMKALDKATSSMKVEDFQ